MSSLMRLWYAVSYMVLMALVEIKCTFAMRENWVEFGGYAAFWTLDRRRSCTLHSNRRLYELGHYVLWS